jgi:2-polyprenyl-3-methyl-5-hydroxy-6-metoxy-1,4-benzoquinol methylase
VIADVRLYPSYSEWNTKWGAPDGYPVERPLLILNRLNEDPDPARYGPFGFQRTSETRRFEYPWAFLNARIEPGMRVLDVGGGLNGLQFVAALEGAEVVNVDPAADIRFPRSPQDLGTHLLAGDDHARLNQLLGTNVTLIRKKVQDSGLAAGSFDRAFCLSVLEHVDADEARSMLAAVGDLLAPGGRFLVTIDLFLDVQPFGVRDHNFYGENHDIHQLLDGLDVELEEGDTKELLGFPDFDFDGLVSRIPVLLKKSRYPVLSQAFILCKPGA